MKSILEIITILVFLFIIALFQKMDEGYCDSTYNIEVTPRPMPPTNTVNNNTIIITATYKDAKGSSLTPSGFARPVCTRAKRHSTALLP